jgi:hypothetical protein
METNFWFFGSKLGGGVGGWGRKTPKKKINFLRFRYFFVSNLATITVVVGLVEVLVAVVIVVLLVLVVIIVVVMVVDELVLYWQ